MEAALLSCFLNTILSKILCLAEEKYKVYSGIKHDLEFLEKELRTISSFIDGQLSSVRDDLSHMEKILIGDLRKVSHRIEDCIDSLMFLAIQKRQAPLWLKVRRYLSTQQSQSIQEIAKELKRLRNMPAEDHARSARYRTKSSSQLAGCSSCSSSESDLLALAAAEDSPVGIDDPRNELVEQLAEPQKQLKVVAIVGLAGSGKTVLARAVYDSQTGKGFDLRAWVNAAERDPKETRYGLPSTGCLPDKSQS